MNVTVVAPGGTSATSPADEFTYMAAPTVTKRQSRGGPSGGGTAVTITGTNLTGARRWTSAATAVTTFTGDSATQIVATSPAGGGTVNVTVATPGGTSATSAADDFTYYGADGDGRQSRGGAFGRRHRR